MNTRIYVILEILPDSFEMGKRILKDWKGVHIGIKVFQALLPRRKTKTPNKESSRKEISE